MTAATAAPAAVTPGRVARRRPSRTARLRSVAFGRLTTGGLAIGLMFWWRSLTPTLMPRAWVMQAAMSAICLAAGYGFGTLASALVQRGLRRLDRQPGPGAARSVRLLLAALAVVAVAVGVPLWSRWQNDQRALVDLDPLPWVRALPMLALTVVLTLIFGIIGRVIGGLVRKLDRWNRRKLPHLVASPVTAIVVVLVASFLVRDVAFTRFTNWAGTTFGQFDEGTNEGTVQPTTATVSGGPGSLSTWETLGVQGRDFVAQATTAEELRAFHGADADVTDPVRVYAGLDGAGSASERAALVVDELERTGGFDRRVLVVATSTGTGWIDPDAAEAIEMLHRGDTAIASMQYSFLPSWISFITDLDLASEAGSELWNAVHERWSELPEDDRPQLIAFGLSLGAFGGESAFVGRDAASSIANLEARTEGALFVGSPASSQMLRQLTDARDPGSPVWEPIIDGGERVRFLTRDPDRAPIETLWEGPRILFVQHPSDPVTYWDFDWMTSSPGWMERPRGYDVPDTGGWFPFVTFTQGVFDLMAGFGAPPGFGHDYRLDYVEAWSQVVPPDGWTDDDSARLLDHLFPEA